MYKQKYLKYKQKYLELKKIGGSTKTKTKTKVVIPKKASPLTKVTVTSPIPENILRDVEIIDKRDSNKITKDIFKLKEKKELKSLDAKLEYNDNILNLKKNDEKWNKEITYYGLEPSLFKILKNNGSIYKCKRDYDLHDDVNRINDNNVDELFINEFSVKKMIELYELIFNVELKLKSVFPNVDTKQFMNVRYSNDNEYYIISSIHTNDDNYINKIDDITEYIKRYETDEVKIKLIIQTLKSQKSSIDNNHLENDSITLSILKNLISIDDGSNISFQHLFLLVYSLKRLIQDKITDFILNYSVIYNDGYKIYRQNKIYSYFILNTVKDIENKINENMVSGFFLNELNEKLFNEKEDIEYKDFILDQLKNTLKIKVILKGGNLIKYIYDDELEVSDGMFKLKNYDEYYKKLSDYDFDIKIDFFNPIILTKFYKDFRLCNNIYIEIYQLIKIIVIEFINKYFYDIKNNYNNLVPKYKFKDVESSINCNIEIFNIYIRSFSKLVAVNPQVVKKLASIPFLNIERKNLKDNWKTECECMSSLKRLSKNTCELYKYEFYQNLNCKDLPLTENTKNSILSYISSQYIGNINKNNRLQVEFFDLTRLCLRFDVLDSGIKSKAECIDFGIFNFGKQDMEKGISTMIKYNYILLDKNITFYGKSIKYLIDELIVLIIRANTKNSKRLLRIFMILDKIIKMNFSVFEIFMSENKFMSNLYFQNIITTYSDFNLISFNLIDVIIILFNKKKELVRLNEDELNKWSSYKLFKDAYLNFIKNINEPEFKIKIKIKNFDFNSYLSNTELKNILEL